MVSCAADCSAGLLRGSPQTVQHALLTRWRLLCRCLLQCRRCGLVWHLHDGVISVTGLITSRSSSTFRMSARPRSVHAWKSSSARLLCCSAKLQLQVCCSSKSQTVSASTVVLQLSSS